LPTGFANWGFQMNGDAIGAVGEILGAAGGRIRHREENAAKKHERKNY